MRISRRRGSRRWRPPSRGSSKAAPSAGRATCRRGSQGERMGADGSRTSEGREVCEQVSAWCQPKKWGCPDCHPFCSLGIVKGTHTVDELLHQLVGGRWFVQYRGSSPSDHTLRYVKPIASIVPSPRSWPCWRSRDGHLTPHLRLVGTVIGHLKGL